MRSLKDFLAPISKSKKYRPLFDYFVRVRRVVLLLGLLMAMCRRRKALEWPTKLFTLVLMIIGSLWTSASSGETSPIRSMDA